MERRKLVLNYLANLGIPYSITEHPPLNTIEDTKTYWEKLPGAKCKNLFFRNNKGNKHYLLVMDGDKQVDTKALKEKTGQRMTFASDKRLDKYLGLQAGSVSPFGLINDKDREVNLLIDRDVFSEAFVNFHPNENTATLTLSLDDFKLFLGSVTDDYTLIDL